MIPNHSFQIYPTTIGHITIASKDDFITHILFGQVFTLPGVERNSPLTDLAYDQLQEYLDGSRTSFQLPLLPSGTDFQKRVWNALCTIPYGETRSYEDIAHLVNSPSACRAVGMANNKNPISIVVPCHRVIGKNGSLTGYGGGMDLKQHLLSLEQKKTP